MSAERRLREAAEVLRTRAEAATPGPWTAERGNVYEIPQSNCEYPMVDRHEDASYIATMHPLVGLAFADWLDAEAQEHAHGHDSHDFTHAFRMADLILGDDQ